MKTKEPMGTARRRKNLRGLPQRLQAVVDRPVKQEFPALEGWVFVCAYSDMKIGKDTEAATYEPYSGMIEFNLTRAREEYLTATDQDLEDTARHELIHADLHQRGLPFGDNDIPFIMECLRRKVTVNPPSIQAFEAQYGRGSFALFQRALPEPEREVIMLAEGSGCWLKVKETKHD